MGCSSNHYILPMKPQKYFNDRLITKSLKEDTPHQGKPKKHYHKMNDKFNKGRY